MKKSTLKKIALSLAIVLACIILFGGLSFIYLSNLETCCTEVIKNNCICAGVSFAAFGLFLSVFAVVEIVTD